MKTVIMFYSGYIPGKRYGGPVTSMFHFSEMFGDEYDIRIVCKNHDFLEKTVYEGINEGWNQVGKAKVMYLSDDAFSGREFNRIITEIEPDLIYTSSIFSAAMNLPLIRIAKNKSIPLILAPRGELSRDRLRVKTWKKKPYIMFIKMIGLLKGIKLQATSESEYEDIVKVLSVNPCDVYTIPNIPCFTGNKARYTKEKGKIRIVSTSRLQHKNNQLYSIKIVNQMRSIVKFDIYGPKEDPDYWALCEEEIKKAPNNVEYNYKGVLPLTEIENVYLGYDCLLHPTHSENYGHVIVEALCHECPVVISRGTTPWNDIEEVNAGFTCNLGSDRDFVAALEKIAEMTNEGYHYLIDGTHSYIERFNLFDIKNKYQQMIYEVIGSKKVN